MKLLSFFICLLLITNASYAQNAVNEKGRTPKNIILMIGDGMSTSQIYAGMVANKNTLNLERAQFVGFHKNQSANNFITDSAAGATALSTGKKTLNDAVGVDSDGKPQLTILEAAEQNGLATGMVVTCSITHATPASFIAHQPYRGMNAEIAADFLRTDTDVFIGGGKNDFDKRKDGLNLIDSLKSHGYQIAGSMEEAQKVKSGKLAAFLAEGDLPSISAGRGNQLSVSSEIAISILKQNDKGFFLMVEGSQIDWGGHKNNLKYITDEVVDFDNAIGKIFDFAEKDGNTLVIITADHETGGLSIRGGNTKTGEIKGSFSTKKHTGVMIPVFAFGPGAEAFAGIYENTAIFDKMIAALKLKK